MTTVLPNVIIHPPRDRPPDYAKRGRLGDERGSEGRPSRRGTGARPAARHSSKSHLSSRRDRHGTRRRSGCRERSWIRRAAAARCARAWKEPRRSPVGRDGKRGSSSLGQRLPRLRRLHPADLVLHVRADDRRAARRGSELPPPPCKRGLHPRLAAGWRTQEGLRLGEGIERAQELYGGLAWKACIGYQALSMRRAGVVTSIYASGESVYGFALTRPGDPICR